MAIASRSFIGVLKRSTPAGSAPARPVGADEAEHLALLDLERDPVEGDRLPVTLCRFFEPQNRVPLPPPSSLPQRPGNFLPPDATSVATLPRQQVPVSRIRGPKYLGAGEPIYGANPPDLGGSAGSF